MANTNLTELLATLICNSSLERAACQRDLDIDTFYMNNEGKARDWRKGETLVQN